MSFVFLKRCTLAVSMIFSGFIFKANAESDQKDKALPIVCLVQIVEHPALNETRKGIIDGLEKHGFVNGSTMTFKVYNAQGSAVMSAQIAKEVASLSPTITIALGTPVAQALASAVSKETPVIFSSVTDPASARLTASNIAGVSNFVPSEKRLTEFKKILPHLNKIGMIYNPGDQNSNAILKDMEKACETLKIELITAQADKTASVSTAAQSLIAKGVDAILVNNDNTALSAFSVVVREGDKQNVPVLVSDIDVLDLGGLAAYGPDQYDLGRQTVDEMIEPLLTKKKKLSELSVGYPRKINLKVNEKVKEKLLSKKK